MAQNSKASVKDQSNVYRYINPSKNIPHFYELLNRDKRHLYFMQFHVVKIKTAENTYEYLLTNLPHIFAISCIAIIINYNLRRIF